MPVLPSQLLMLLLPEASFPGQAREIGHPLRVRVLQPQVPHQELADDAQEPPAPRLERHAEEAAEDHHDQERAGQHAAGADAAAAAAAMKMSEPCCSSSHRGLGLPSLPSSSRSPSTSPSGSPSPSTQAPPATGPSPLVARRAPDRASILVRSSPGRSIGPPLTFFHRGIALPAPARRRCSRRFAALLESRLRSIQRKKRRENRLRRTRSRRLPASAAGRRGDRGLRIHSMRRAAVPLPGAEGLGPISTRSRKATTASGRSTRGARSRAGRVLARDPPEDRASATGLWARDAAGRPL